MSDWMSCKSLSMNIKRCQYLISKLQFHPKLSLWSAPPLNILMVWLMMFLKSQPFANHMEFHYMSTQPLEDMCCHLLKCREKLNLNHLISELMEWQALMLMCINMDTLPKDLPCSFIKIPQSGEISIFRLPLGREEFTFLQPQWAREMVDVWVLPGAVYLISELKDLEKLLLQFYSRCKPSLLLLNQMNNWS